MMTVLVVGGTLHKIVKLQCWIVRHDTTNMDMVMRWLDVYRFVRDDRIESHFEEFSEDMSTATTMSQNILRYYSIAALIHFAWIRFRIDTAQAMLEYCFYRLWKCNTRSLGHFNLNSAAHADILNMVNGKWDYFLRSKGHAHSDTHPYYCYFYSNHKSDKQLNWMTLTLSCCIYLGRHI